MILEILWNDEISIEKSIKINIVYISMSRIKGFDWLYVERNKYDLGHGIFFNLNDIAFWRVTEVLNV